MPSTTNIACANCGKIFAARTADVKRGWGIYCSKSCKASKQTRDTNISGPDYRASGCNVGQMINGQYAKSQFKEQSSGKRWFPTNVAYEEWDDEVINGDVKYSKRHQCWLVCDDGDDPLIDSHPFDSDAAGFRNT